MPRGFHNQDLSTIFKEHELAPNAELGLQTGMTMRLAPNALEIPGWIAGASLGGTRRSNVVSDDRCSTES
jgi:hypothetical protein